MKKRFLSTLLVLCMVLALLPGTAAAATVPTAGICGNHLTWEYDNVTRILTINGVGPMTNYSSGSSIPWYGLSNVIRSVVISDGVTSIGSCAFYGLKVLTDVQIPDSVIVIGKNAFYNCFELPSVTIPGSVTSIGQFAFYQCQALSDVTIPSSVTSIGEGVFASCQNLADIKLENGNTAYVSDGGVLLDAKRTIILAYPAMKSGVTYRIPNSVTTIGWGAFSDCPNLVSVTIPDSVTSIGAAAFESCTGLIGISIPDSITEIGAYTFLGCSGLKSITIPPTVTSVGMQTFDRCNSLTDVYFTGSQEERKLSFYAGTQNENAARADWHYESTGPETELTVIFDAMGGTLPNNMTSPTAITGAANRLSSLPEPTRYGYTFDGWFTYEGEQVTVSNVYTQNNMVIYAHWTETTPIYTVTFHPNGGALSSSTTWTTGKNGTLSSLPTPTRSGYTFDGWYTASTGGTKVTTQTVFTGDTTIYAHWTETVPDTPSTPDTPSIPSETDSDFTIKDGVLTEYNGPGGVVTIPNTVSEVGGHAFEDCDSLTAVTIPASVTTIGSYAFSKCDSLTAVTLPNSVTEIGFSSFSDCSSLTSVTLPASLTTIGSYAFSWCSKLTGVTLPDSLTTIGSSAFSGCDSLTSVTIPANVTKIDEFAFYGCDNLVSVTISHGVTNIRTSAFENCKSLSSVIIPTSVTNIGYKAFYTCDNLTIHGPSGSYAQTYARQNGIPFAVEGSSNTPSTPAVTPIPSSGTAYTSTQMVDVDGQSLEFQCYALKDADGYYTNYIKLRDLAIVLNGTPAQFQVGWDGDVTITTGSRYTPVGSELSTPFSGNRAYQKSDAATKVNRQTVQLTAFVLNDDSGGGYTYYQLRDLGQALEFNVGWSAERGIFLETNKPYDAGN